MSIKAKIPPVQLRQCLSSLDKNRQASGQTPRQTVGQKQARQSGRKLKFEFPHKRYIISNFQKP